MSVLASSAYNSGRWYTAPSAAVSDGAICPHMRATLTSGLVTTVKMVSMLALTAAFSYSVALIAVRVPWVSGG